MSDGGVDDGQVLAPRRPGPLFDSHPKRVEAELRVANEREQQRERRQTGRKGDDLWAWPLPIPARYERGAIPESGHGHRAGLYVSSRRRPNTIGAGAQWARGLLRLGRGPALA